MLVISLVSQKGGGGKSTLAVNLAVLAAQKAPSFLIDGDPYRQTTSSWVMRRNGIKESRSISASPILIGTSRKRQLEIDIGRLRSKPGFLFIDTQPSVIEMEAVRASDLVLVPVRPNPEDLEAVGNTLAMVRSTGRRCGIVINAARTDRRALEAYRALRRVPEQVCPHFLRDQVVYSDAYIGALGVSEMKGSAARAATAEVQEVWCWALGMVCE